MVLSLTLLLLLLLFIIVLLCLLRLLTSLFAVVLPLVYGCPVLLFELPCCQLCCLCWYCVCCRTVGYVVVVVRDVGVDCVRFVGICVDDDVAVVLQLCALSLLLSLCVVY